MATTCLQCTFLSTSLVPGLRAKSWMPEEIWQGPVVLKQRRFPIVAEGHSSQGVNSIVHKVRQPFLALAGSGFGLISSAQAQEDSDAVRTYEAFVKGTSSATQAVGSDGGDAFANVTAALGNNAIVVGGVVVLAVGVPLLFSALLRKGYAGDVSVQEALDSLEKESGSILVDVRQNNDIAEEGSPKIRKKKALRVQYRSETDGALSTDPAFLSKMEARASKKDAALYVVDKSGKTASAAAKSLTQAGYTKVFAVKGGTDAWLANELPWLKPTNFTLDLGGLKEAIDATVKDNANVLPATLGITAAAAGSFLLFSEAETALQLLGLAGLTQVAVQKLLYAEDRKKTLQQLRSFLDTKVAPQELVDEIKEIGNALLPSQGAEEPSSTPPKPEPSKPAPFKPEPSKSARPNLATSEPATSERAPSKRVTSEPSPVASSKSTSSRSSSQNGNGQGGSKDPAKSDSSVPPSAVPLSPYASYPELKPPASPTP